MFGNTLDLQHVQQSNTTILLHCLKTHHKLQDNKCIEEKKNDALVANVNFTKSPQKSAKIH